MKQQVKLFMANASLQMVVLDCSHLLVDRVCYCDCLLFGQGTIHSVDIPINAPCPEKAGPKPEPEQTKDVLGCQL